MATGEACIWLGYPTIPQLFILELAGLGMKPTDAGFDSTYCQESESSPDSTWGKLVLDDGDADATEAMVAMCREWWLYQKAQNPNHPI